MTESTATSLTLPVPLIPFKPSILNDGEFDRALRDQPFQEGRRIDVADPERSQGPT
jgi:hypothetical protein